MPGVTVRGLVSFGFDHRAPAGVEPAFPASDAGVVSVGPQGLGRLGDQRRMQDSNPRDALTPTTVFKTVALPDSANPPYSVVWSRCC